MRFNWILLLILAHVSCRGLSGMWLDIFQHRKRLMSRTIVCVDSFASEGKFANSKIRREGRGKMAKTSCGSKVKYIDVPCYRANTRHEAKWTWMKLSPLSNHPLASNHHQQQEYVFLHSSSSAVLILGLSISRVVCLFASSCRTKWIAWPAEMNRCYVNCVLCILWAHSTSIQFQSKDTLTQYS